MCGLKGVERYTKMFLKEISRQQLKLLVLLTMTRITRKYALSYLMPNVIYMIT